MGASTGTAAADATGVDSGASYRLGVAVANPDTVPQLMRTAVDIARDRGGEIIVLSAVVEPRGSPFAVFRDEVIKREFGADRATIMENAVAAVEGTGVPVEGQLLVARSVPRALLRGISEFDCDAVLLGWEERSGREAVFGTNADLVAAGAPCDVFVERIGPTADGVESLLLPVVDGPHTERAADAARAIADANDARVDVRHVLAPDATDADHEATADLVADIHDRLGGVETTGEIIEATDVPGAILNAAAGRDVTVLGATRRRGLRRHLAGSIPLTVGREAPSTVILARRGGGVPSWLGRLRAAVVRGP